MQVKDVGLLESTYLGAVAGLAEIMVNHPLWVIKTRAQCGYPFTLNIFALYKGITYHASSEVFLCAFQVAIGIQLNQKLYKHMHDYSALVGSMISGFLSGLITSPTELLMTYQQRYKSDSKIFAVAKQQGYRKFLIGFPAVGLREAFYTAGFFWASPLLAEKIYKSDSENEKVLTTFIAGSIAGLISTIITHPLDTVKSIQHNQAFEPQSISFVQAAKSLYSAGGYSAFFRGIVARSARVVAASGIISGVLEKLTQNTKEVKIR